MSMNPIFNDPWVAFSNATKNYSAEEIYQIFKARLMAELSPVVESGSHYGELVDKPTTPVAP